MLINPCALRMTAPLVPTGNATQLMLRSVLRTWMVLIGIQMAQLLERYMKVLRCFLENPSLGRKSALISPYLVCLNE